MRTTTYKQAKHSGEISQEILVYPSEPILVCAEGIKHLDKSTQQDMGGGG
ncbi:hypothetical protein OQH61_02195 [Helicobacter sp. MIT 21-1697]|nr:hypothetical protein [Helicobacter sp. MIT 21-1697]MCX2716540.1 hypothetical protein [Helicobacter sp. MIT 21-1697]